MGFPALVKHAAAQQRYVGCREMPDLPIPAPEKPPGAAGLTARLWDEGAQQRSRDWDTGIGKASVYKGQIPVTKINLCFPFPTLPCHPHFFFVFVLNTNFVLGKMEAPSVTNQTNKRRK